MTARVGTINTYILSPKTPSFAGLTEHKYLGYNRSLTRSSINGYFLNVVYTIEKFGAVSWADTVVVSVDGVASKTARLKTGRQCGVCGLFANWSA